MSVRHSRAVYDVLLHAVRGLPAPDEALRRAADATSRLWHRALRIEQCAPAAERALRATGQLGELPAHARELLRRAASNAVRNALLVPEQLARIATVAERHGIDVIALKGSARLLYGEMPGTRTIDDIDLLVHAEHAWRFHSLLAKELECAVTDGAPAHHLPLLTPRTGVPVEIHVRCSSAPSRLDALVWQGARPTACGAARILVPDETLLALHGLEHAVLTHWAMRYRLRDVLDVASAFARDVELERVERHVRESRSSSAMETLLAAAATLERRIPRHRPGAWRTVARVGRFRLAASFWSDDSRQAERLLTVGSVAAEGSAEGWGRLVRVALRWRPRRPRTRVAAVALALGALAPVTAGCNDGSGPGTIDIPPFVFASDAEGALALYRYDEGAITRLTDLGDQDDEPHAAGARIVFSSARDGNREIYFIPAPGVGARRITTHAATDGEPALRRDGGMIAFVSSRSGTPRIWVVDTLGNAPTALATGSATFVPERAPAWGPNGNQLAFTSTRTGTSQVWVVAATGGNAVQVTHETGGAFDPSWSADGSVIFYGEASGVLRAMQVVVATGETSVAGSDPEGLAQPACVGHDCLGVRRPYTSDADIVAFRPGTAGTLTVIARPGADRHPSVLSP